MKDNPWNPGKVIAVFFRGGQRKKLMLPSGR